MSCDLMLAPHSVLRRSAGAVKGGAPRGSLLH